MLILCTCIFLCCVLILTATAIGLTESGVKPKEDTTTATVVFTTYLYKGEYLDKIKVKVDGEEGLADMRELETCVKDCTLKEYTSLILWEAKFTYVKKDGTKEECTYRKTDVNKGIDKFLDKYYKP